MSRLSQAERLSRDLRTGRSKHLACRRYIVGASLFCCGTMTLAGFYQFGIIDRVPDVSLPRFDSNKVIGSAQAYEILASPDAVLAIGSYASTAALASAGGMGRHREHPYLVLLMMAKIIVDAVFALKLVRDQIVRQNWTFCIWCLATTAATLTMLPAALPETRAALRARRRAS